VRPLSFPGELGAVRREQLSALRRCGHHSAQVWKLQRPTDAEGRVEKDRDRERERERPQHKDEKLNCPL